MSSWHVHHAMATLVNVSCSSGDPLSNMNVQFGSPEEAITFCERNGWRWYVDGAAKPKKERVKNYGINFAWNKRTRVSTK